MRPGALYWVRLHVSRVTVLVPTYNAGPYLGDCLRSIQAQSITDWQAVIGDNASTDESVDVVVSLDDSRFRVVRRSRTIGWVANVNLLLSEAAGEYVAVLHADDWWEPEFLARTVERLEAAPGSLLATTGVREMREGQPVRVLGLHTVWPVGQGATCSRATAARLFTAGCPVRASGVLARAALYAGGGYEESLPQCCDWHLWIKAACLADVEVVADPLANYRVHEHSLTADFMRANLWGIDMVRMLRLLEADWATAGEPFAGASRRLAGAIVSDLLGDVVNRSEAGDIAGAVAQARLARAAAASPAQLAVAAAAEGLMLSTGPRRLRGLRRLLIKTAGGLRRAQLRLAGDRELGRAA